MSHAVEPRRPRYLVPIDVIRGALIGMAELVPGVSGGTVALVTGVYDALITSANHVVQAVRRLVFGPDRMRNFTAELRRVDWWLLIPVTLGMVTVVFALAGVMGSFVADAPQASRGLFFGMVAASVVVPLRMALAEKRKHSPAWEWLIVATAATLAFVLTSFAGGQVIEDPALPLVFVAAAVAICALVVPGISGSFFLLTIGLYAPTMAAVHDRNFAYLGVFMLGAVVGLAAFVKILHHLLANHRRSTLLVMVGLMIGSLRALWPWQSAGAANDKGSGQLLAPGEPLLLPIVLAVVGAVVVITLVLIEDFLQRRSELANAPADGAHPHAG